MNQKWNYKFFNHRFIFSAIYWNQVQKSDIWFLGLLVVETWNPQPSKNHFILAFLFPSLILLFRRNLASDKRQYKHPMRKRTRKEVYKEGVWSFGAFLNCYSMKRWSASFWVCKFLKLLDNMWCVVLSRGES